MKIFLNTCIIAMISAGIYGAFDVARDITHNTYIQYEEGESNFASNAVQQKSLSNVIRTARHEVSATTEKKKTIKEPELNMEYFSRSGPVYSDERFLEELNIATDSTGLLNDSAKIRSTQVVAATGNPAPLPDTVIDEKRKFDISLYSRGRPRKIRAERVVQNDSLKK
ncbi:MAG: hypothetical protein ACXVPN_14835 [Bacteroidia bacterium]